MFDTTTKSNDDDWTQRLDAIAEQTVRSQDQEGETDLLQFFNPVLAKHYRQVASNIPTAPEMIAMANFTAFASVCGPNMTARLKPDYPTGLITWAIGLNDTGSSKTDSAKAGHGGLKSCQEYEDDLHARAIQDFKGPAAERPVRKIMNLSGGTVQGQITQLSNTDGAAYRFQDEVIGFWKGMNESNGGKGADEEKWLELWNGNAYTEVNRGAFIEVKRPRLSMMGMTQPKVFIPLLAQLTHGGTTGANGMFARFLLFHPTMPKKRFMSFDNYMNGNHIAEDWNRLNETMMRKIYTLTNHIEWVPDEEGHRYLFKVWNEHFAMDEALPDNKGFIKAFLAKDRAHINRIGGVLAAMDLALEDGDSYPIDKSERIRMVVPLETLQRAVGMYHYFLEQTTRLWYEMQGIEPPASAKVAAAKGGVSPEEKIKQVIGDLPAGEILDLRKLQQSQLKRPCLSLGFKTDELREFLLSNQLAKVVGKTLQVL